MLGARLKHRVIFVDCFVKCGVRIDILCVVQTRKYLINISRVELCDSERPRYFWINVIINDYLLLVIVEHISWDLFRRRVLVAVYQQSQKPLCEAPDLLYLILCQVFCSDAGCKSDASDDN